MFGLFQFAQTLFAGLMVGQQTTGSLIITGSAVVYKPVTTTKFKKQLTGTAKIVKR